MRWKKTVAFGLAAVIAAGMLACGENSQNDGGQPNEQGSAMKGEEGKTGDLKVTADGVTEKGVYPIVPEKITMTALIVQQSYCSDITTQEYTRWLEELTNIHLDMITVSEDVLKEKLNIMLQTGDYTDLIMSGAASGNSDIVKYGIEEKIYVPLNDYIEKYSQNLAERWEELPHIKEGMTAPDGNVYALPRFNGSAGHGAIPYKQWVNQGWLEKLGMDVPTTVDEYYDMLAAFKNEDPNGNGIQDEIPLTGAYGTWAAEPYYFILNAFDYFDESLVKLKDGKFSSTADSEEFRQGLEFLNKLYQDGLLDPVSLTQDLTQMTQLCQNEGDLVGAYSSGHIGMGIDYTNKEVFENWTYILPLKGTNGYQGIPVSDAEAISGGWFAITDKCKNPAAAFRMADLWFGDRDSYEEQNWDKGRLWDEPSEGAKGITGYDATAREIPREGDLETRNWSNSTAYGAEKDRLLYLEFTGDIKDAANYEAYLSKVTEEYKKYRSDFEQIMPNWTDSETAEQLTNLSTPLSDYVKSSIVDFITGNKEASDNIQWQKYLDGLDKLGYYDYIKLRQETYSE